MGEMERGLGRTDLWCWWARGQLAQGPPRWTVGGGSWWRHWHCSGGVGVAWSGLEAPVGGGEASWRLILGGGRSGVGAPR
jgi:hypothetical protein